MHKYESLRLDDYTLNPLSILKNYSIHNEKYKKGYIVYKGVSKTTSQYVKIYKRPFLDSQVSRHRLFTLLKAFRKGIILAENIFLSCERDSYYLYTIEPDLSCSKYDYIPLTGIIKGEELDYMKKQTLFQSILRAIKGLHGLGEAYLEISPKNIFVKDHLQVKLKPFRPDKPGHNITFGNNRLSTGHFGKMSTSQPNDSNHSKYWYIAPEQLLSDSKTFHPETFANETESSAYSNTYDGNPNDFASDMWSLGCVFAELFVTLTPIFQSVNANDTIIKIFQVLGTPPLNEVPYICLDLYTNIENQIDQEQELPLIVPITQSLSKSEAQILTSLLTFDPNKRPTANIILELPFFKAYTPQKYQQKSAISLLQALQRPENSPLTYKKSAENLSSAHQSLCKSTLRRQTGSREALVKHRLTSGVSRCNSTFNVIPINQGDWWNTSIIEPPQDNIDTIGGRSSNYGRSSSQLRERSRLSSVKKTLDFEETEPTERNNIETVQTFSDIDQTGHFEVQSPCYFSCNVQQQQNDISLRSEYKTQKVQAHDDYQPILNHYDIERQNYNSVAVREPENSSAYKRRSLINTKQNYNSTPTKSHHQSQVFGRTRPQERKEEHEQQMQYLESQHKLSKRSPIKVQAKAKLSVNIDTIKLKRPDTKASYGCRVILKNRDNDHLSKEKIDIFSCFAPMEDYKVKLDFKGEAELSAESFLQMYSNESLEIQVFYQKSSEFNQYNDTEDAEATVYGASKINLGLTLPQLYSLIGEGMPIRARRDWYPMYDPQYPTDIVGQLKLAISVEFTGDLNRFKNSKSIERRNQSMRQQSPLEESRYTSQFQVKENYERKSLMREMDYYSEANGSTQKKVHQKRTSHLLTTPPQKESLVNLTFDGGKSEKKANRDVLAFDERVQNMNYQGYETAPKELNWSNKTNQLRTKYLSQRLEI